MKNYNGYVSVDALMKYAHNHVGGTIDSNDIARFPRANVKEVSNEQQSLEMIFDLPFDRLRELASAEREGRVVVLPCKVGDTVWCLRNYCGTIHPRCGIVSDIIFHDRCGVSVVVFNIGRGKWGEKVFASYKEAAAALTSSAGEGE
ncbi:MAG: hypothetical protein VB062_04685 [Christensenella sp.]|nr:hypothetical protein [Christensenella sp.]